MILNRMLQNIKTQNWFAVAVEFVIVVFGVFVGLEVQEWNNQRQFANQEVVLLKEMQKEIETNNMLVTQRVKSMNQVFESGKRAIAFLEKDEPCEERCWPLLVDFFTASQAFFTPSYSSVYEEMKPIGLPQSTELKKTIDRYYVLSATMESALDSNPKYRQIFREILTVNGHQALWANCHRIKDFFEEIISDCPQELADEEIVSILNKLRNTQEIIGYLNYWIGMHTLWRPIYHGQLEHGESAIEAINAELQVSE